ncbi:MAG: YceI family protein [Vicinamibacterales bacterium]
MKSTVIGVVLAAAALVSPGTWRVGQGDVRVICPLTVGGSFEAKTAALKGSVTVGANGSQTLDGSLAVDLRTLDTGIGLRNEHLREKYLEVNKGTGFDMATLSAIALTGLSPIAPEGKGSFTGLLAVHGVVRPVAGSVDVRRAGDSLRVKASFRLDLPDYNIAKPRYLGIGVTDNVQVEVAFDVSRGARW